MSVTSRTLHDTIRNVLSESIREFKEGRLLRINDPMGFDSTELYMLPLDKEEIEEYRVARFADTRKDGILYRPAIVNQMKQVILDPNNILFGTMIKGPHGIGKSHSLVNLVRNLRSEGHFVTFIPDCERWYTSYDFVVAVCRSLNIKPQDLGLGHACSDDEAKLLADCIVDTLKKVNSSEAEEDALHWFLVFDQVNRVFGRAEFENARDVGVLARPFAFMKYYCTKDNVHSVIAASVNNTLAYKENHEGFREYLHPINMSREEVKQWKPKACGNFSEEEWTTIEDATGFCPLQVSEYLDKDPNCYVEDSIETVRTEIAKLWRETKTVEDNNDIAANAINCLLSVPVKVKGHMYDKKYSVVSDGYLRPLFPAVLHAYRSFFWERLMDYVDKQEKYLLATCANPSVTNDTRERLFELIVISRFQKKNVVAENPSEVVLPGMVDTGCVFETQQLPHPSQMDNNSLFIPKNSNFPAIDLILKEDKSVWAIQVHVSDHSDVAPKFKSMCEDQGWFKAFDNIFLVYLSPSPEVTARLCCLPATPSRRKRQRLANETRPEIQVSALSVSDFECLKDLQWQPPSSEAMEVDD